MDPQANASDGYSEFARLCKSIAAQRRVQADNLRFRSEVIELRAEQLGLPTDPVLLVGADVTAADLVDVKKVEVATNLYEQISALQLQLRNLKVRSAVLWRESMRGHEDSMAMHMIRLNALVDTFTIQQKRDRDHNLLLPD